VTVPLWVAPCVAVLATLAARADVRTRRIPNRLTGPALALGLVCHGVLGGPHALLDSAVGMLVAGGLLLPGWLMGWMGAGDVKLMAAVGAWLAWPQSLLAVLASLIAGGVMAVVSAVRGRMLGRTLWSTVALGSWVMTRAGRGGAPPVTSGLRFPFGLAILAGSLVAMWVRI
jgi:prepilin peptidase CpaA